MVFKALTYRFQPGRLLFAPLGSPLSARGQGSSTLTFQNALFLQALSTSNICLSSLPHFLLIPWPPSLSSLPRSVSWALQSFSLNRPWFQLLYNNTMSLSKLHFSTSNTQHWQPSVYCCDFFSPATPFLFLGLVPWSSTVSALLCQSVHAVFK